MNEIMTDEETIKGVVNLRKCPFCHKEHVITNIGGIGSGVVGSDGKLPEIQRYNFLCENCKMHFDIPISLYKKL